MTLTADQELLLRAIAVRPTPYTVLRALLGGDSDRTLAAVDGLVVSGRIDRILVRTDTHYRMAPRGR